MRIAYLGPRGTFSEDALRSAIGDAEVEPAPAATVYDAILAVREGEADRALVPFENSIEGAVTATLDTLAFDADGVTLVGEYDLPIRHCLIAREEMPLDRIEAVISHPQPSAQCARFIRENLPQAEVRAAPSTAEAVRTVAESEQPWAALGRRVGGRALRRRGTAPGRRGRARQHHPLRLGRARRAPSRRARVRGAPRWSSPSSARTTPARWWTPSRCSRTARST